VTNRTVGIRNLLTGNLLESRCSVTNTRHVRTVSYFIIQPWFVTIV